MDKVQIKKEEMKSEVGEGQGEGEPERMCVERSKEEARVPESRCRWTCVLCSYHWAYWSHQLHFPKLIHSRPAIDKLH